jgi:hypothetical protein
MHHPIFPLSALLRIAFVCGQTRQIASMNSNFGRPAIVCNFAMTSPVGLRIKKLRHTQYRDGARQQR